MSNNKLIAEFMDAEPDKRTFFHTGQEVYFYQTSWDWLMPVVGKCLNLIKHQAVLEQWGDLYNCLPSCNIDEVYEAVVEFIKAQNKYPFNEGDDYWVVEDGNLMWGVWDDASEDMHDENPNRKYFTEEEAIDYARAYGIKYITNNE